MASSSSFDVVSEVELPEITNAVDQAAREIAQRFDFKNTETTVKLEDDTTVQLESSTEDRLVAALGVVKDKAVKRKISLKALQEGPVESAAKGHSRQKVTITTGIPEDKAKAIVKALKGSGIKVQSQIMGDQVRVTGKKRDDLQAAIAALKDQDFGLPLQFTNYR
ncbi:MAG: YajQ family cyclic di-GMP-binding protein [Actinomycetota bacterium]